MSDTIKYRGFQIILEPDEDAHSPREDDNLGTMVLEHGKYKFPKEADVDLDREIGSESFESYMQKYHDAAVVLPVWGYDHGDLHMKAGKRTFPFDDPWDSGLLGIIYVTRQKLVEEYGHDTLETREQAVKVLEAEVEAYDQWHNGDCWGYLINDSVGRQRFSCWGYLGQEAAIQEAKAEIDAQYAKGGSHE